jgi:putative hydrolase of the HAD superfamily
MRSFRKSPRAFSPNKLFGERAKLREDASALVKIATDYKLNPQNMTRLQKEINRFENHPVELLPFARKALNQMKHFRKFLITKGNEQEQRRKLKLSNMSNLFDEILIVNKKNTKEIWKIFSDRNIAFDSTIFIGNSIQHDILPAVENGGRAALSRY